jgi:hypothetical protein
MSSNLSVMVQDVYLAVDSDQEPLTVSDIMDRAVPVRPFTVEEPPTPGPELDSPERRLWRIVFRFNPPILLVMGGLRAGFGPVRIRGRVGR